MARFDIYANPEASERAHTPFLLDVQNDHLVRLETRVVIPLRTPKSFGYPVRDLNPTLEVEGRSVIADTASLAPVPTHMLRRPVGRAEARSGEVLDAIDTLFGGY